MIAVVLTSSSYDMCADCIVDALNNTLWLWRIWFAGTLDGDEMHQLALWVFESFHPQGKPLPAARQEKEVRNPHLIPMILT